MDESIKLFAEKGFAAASVQDIATACGISKGAFYLHFKSKEALLLAILQDHFQLMDEQMAFIEEQDLAPREKFVRQIEQQVRHMYVHKNSFIIQTHEHAIPSNSEVKAVLFKARMDISRFYRKRLLAIYGDTIGAHFWELMTALQGIQQSFLQLAVLDQAELDCRRLAEFMLHCADEMEAGLRRRIGRPVLDPNEMNELFQQKISAGVLFSMLNALKNGEFKEDILVSLDVIEQEITRSEPRAAVLRGMLANLPGEPRFLEFKHALKDYYRLA